MNKHEIVDRLHVIVGKLIIDEYVGARQLVYDLIEELKSDIQIQEDIQKEFCLQCGMRFHPMDNGKCSFAHCPSNSEDVKAYKEGE